MIDRTEVKGWHMQELNACSIVDSSSAPAQFNVYPGAGAGAGRLWGIQLWIR